jgi:hypothetical protein
MGKYFHLATVERVALSEMMVVNKWNRDFNMEYESLFNFGSV